MTWCPSSKVASRIANALLKASRADQLPDEWPGWADPACVFAITHSRLTIGARLQLARLWRQYGQETWADREAPVIQIELLEHISMSA